MSLRTITLNDAESADAAFESSLAELSESNPGLFTDPRIRLTREQLREIARSFFYLGFAAGETNTLNKIRHE